MGAVEGLFLSFGLAVCSTTTNNPTQHDRYVDAAKQSFNAGYEQSGLKKNIDKELKDLEVKYVPKDVEKYGSVTVIVIKVIFQKELSLSWSF
jgi:hypothetical protein